MIDLNKLYQTQRGEPVRVLCVDAEPPYSVIGLVANRVPMMWDKTGKALPGWTSQGRDLVELPDRREWPHRGCKTPSECRQQNMCLDPWHCGSLESTHRDECDWYMWRMPATKRRTVIRD